MKTRRRTTNLAFVLTAIMFLAPGRPALAASQTMQVSGTMHENFAEANFTAHGIQVTALDTWTTGSFAGSPGVLHIFSSEFIDFDHELNVISTRMIFTSQGNLFMSEVGERDGLFVHVLSTVTGGTGIYKGATGQLVLEGVHGNGVEFTYAGGITLAN